jgi:hypothetical protein
VTTHRDTFARSLHDLGLAAWFGGSLMGAVGVNGSAAAAARTKDSTSVAGAGWSAWTPVNLVAIGAHLVGGADLMLANKGRVVGQRGVGGASLAKLALTAVALGATGYSRAIGQKVIEADTPAEDGTTPLEGTDPSIASAQRQLAVLQWIIPASTGALIVLSAVMGEQQRSTEVARGVSGRIVGHLPSGPERHSPGQAAKDALAPLLDALPVPGH